MCQRAFVHCAVMRTGVTVAGMQTQKHIWATAQRGRWIVPLL